MSETNEIKLTRLSRIAIIAVEICWYFVLIGTFVAMVIVIIGVANKPALDYLLPAAASADVTYKDRMKDYEDRMKDAMSGHINVVNDGRLEVLEYSGGTMLVSGINRSIYKFAIGMIYDSAWMIILFWVLRKLVRSLKHGRPFIPDNVRRIRALGLLIILDFPVTWFLNYLNNNQYIGKLDIPGAEISMNAVPEINTLLLGLLILVLAQVFDTGVRLQSDNDLTV